MLALQKTKQKRTNFQTLNHLAIVNCLLNFVVIHWIIIIMHSVLPISSSQSITTILASVCHIIFQKSGHVLFWAASGVSTSYVCLQKIVDKSANNLWLEQNQYSFMKFSSNNSKSKFKQTYCRNCLDA